MTSRVTSATWLGFSEPVASKASVSGTERSNEALHCFPHVTLVTQGCSSGWFPRHESGLFVGFDIRESVSDPAGQLEIGRTSALGSLHTACAVRPNPDPRRDATTFRAWRAPTVDGLRVQLEEAIAADPVRFSRLAPRFINVDPTYGVALLTTLTRLVADQQSGSISVGSSEPLGIPQQLAWGDLLDFGQGVLDHSQPGSDQPSEEVRYGPTWHAAVGILPSF